jgi:hypothetical protein
MGMRLLNVVPSMLGLDLVLDLALDYLTINLTYSIYVTL